MRTPVDDVSPGFSAPTADTMGRNATILFLSALTIMAGATISPALPAIEAHFSASPYAAILTRLTLTVPALFIALFAPLAGALADRYGRKPVAIASVLLYGLSGMSGIFADTLTTLLIGRAVLGIAVAGVMTVATALIGDYFFGRARDRFMGRQAAFVGFGGLFFLTGGGFLAGLHWRAPFLIYAIAFALLPAILAFISETRRNTTSDTGAGRTVGPIMSLPLMGLLAAAILNSVVFYLMPTQLPFHLRAHGVEAPMFAGLSLGAMTLASAVLSFVYGRVRGRLGVSGIFALGFAGMAGGMGLVAAAESFIAVLPGAVLVGCGMGLIMPNLGAGAMALAAENNRGRIAGILTACIFLGQFASPLISQPLTAGSGYAFTFTIGAATALAAALLALVIAVTWRSP